MHHLVYCCHHSEQQAVRKRRGIPHQGNRIIHCWTHAQLRSVFRKAARTRRLLVPIPDSTEQVPHSRSISDCPGRTTIPAHPTDQQLLLQGGYLQVGRIGRSSNVGSDGWNVIIHSLRLKVLGRLATALKCLTDAKQLADKAGFLRQTLKWTVNAQNEPMFLQIVLLFKELAAVCYYCGSSKEA